MMRALRRAPQPRVKVHTPVRSLSRVTIPVVDIASVVDEQELQWIDERDTVRSAVDLMIRSDRDVLAVKSSRPQSDKDECVGVLTEYGLMEKVRIPIRTTILLVRTRACG